MKKYMDKLIKKISFNKNLFVFLAVLILVGVAAGSVFSLIISDSDKKMVADYLNIFLNSASKDDLNFKVTFLNTMTMNLGISLFIWIFGISIIGALLILPILFIKSFVLGFSISSIIINFKFKGIIIAFIYTLPHNILNILVYMLVSAYAIIVSYKMINSMKKKKTFDFKIIMKRYSFILLFSFIILFLSSLYEVFVLPKIIGFAFNLLK